MRKDDFVGLLSPGRARALPEPSNGVWPGLFEVPTGRVHHAIAQSILRTAVRSLPITVAFPDGRSWGAGGPRLQLVNPDNFFFRLGRDGLIGFGEAWMVGDLTAGSWHPGDARTGREINAATDELVAALTVMAARLGDLVPRPLQSLRGAWHSVKPLSEDNKLDTSRDNISRHYDLSNELFDLFLDESLTYSSAVYTSSEPEDLLTAQNRKIDAILDLAGVRPGMTILEIGSGWGALAIRAVQQRDVDVVTLTLSIAQKSLAEKRIAEAGLTDRIQVRLEDYRSHVGKYDAVVSVEMIEAVGEQYWPQYFGCIDALLAPGGRASLQAITLEHERQIATRKTYTWMHKYVFPGGDLPSLKAIDTALKSTSLRVVETRRIGTSYARTLKEWRHRFNEHLPEVYDLGFDETFVRMWNFYLAYTEAGFAARYIDDFQIALSRD
jgi:cyclopropane-fatty-acyl-phospholipid synthase